MDPLYDQRMEMPVHELDGVDFFCNEPRRKAPPEPTVAAYFDSGLTQPELAGLVDRIVAGIAALLARTTTLPMALGHAEWRRADESGPWRQPWNTETRDAIIAGLRADQLEDAKIAFTAGEHDEHRLYFACEAYREPDHAPDASLTMSLFSMDLWARDGADAAADATLALLRDWAQPMRLRAAGVTYDRVRGRGPRSPWDLWYGTNHQVTAPQTAERVRGYFWANLLTAGQVARLGGLPRLRENASEHGLTVEPAGGDAVVLRAPGPVTAFDDDLLAACKQVLGPALIHRAYTLYQGYPLRIIPDPGTAFRKVPSGSPFPRLLAGQGPYADEVS